MGASHSACTCVFDGMVDRYGEEQMLAIARTNWREGPSDFGKAMAHAVNQCRQS